MCKRSKLNLPAGIWAPILSIMLVIVAAAMSADILSTAVPAIKEAPACKI